MRRITPDVLFLLLCLAILGLALWKMDDEHRGSAADVEVRHGSME